MGAWRTFLLWANRQSFGIKDPQFGLDVGFFVFTLPWLRFVVSFVTVVLVLAFVAAAFTHYVYGGLQLPGRGPTTRAAFVHLGILGALIALTRAASYWLDRYSLSTQKGSLLTGITYTDDHAVLPTKAILAVAALMCAGFFLAAIWSRSWRLPITGVALLVVTAVVVGGIYPALIQSLKVNPSQKSLEAKYIERNINATRAAFGLDRVKRIQNPTPAETENKAVLRAAANDIPGVRIIDPNVVAPTFRQLAGPARLLRVPRHPRRRPLHDRQADPRRRRRGARDQPRAACPTTSATGSTTTPSTRTATASTRPTATSAPPRATRSSSRVAASARSAQYQPRMYFGELSPAYSVVGAEKGAPPREFDFPAGGEGDVAVKNTYSGDGGVPIGSTLRRLAYAIKYREANFLLSDAVNGDSRILDHRTPTERVERVAPWLRLDGNVYPAVVQGRVQWIVDGFTTSANYPNSRLIELAEATSDSVAQRSNVVAVGAGQVNYVRNAVKATVDAYTGDVKLYGWDTKDPMLKAWSNAFPGSVRPISEISGDLMAHIRYPQDLLKVQRELLTEYHVTNPGDFYSGSDKWRVPRDPSSSAQDQPPVFQSIAMPGETEAAFSITSPFVPATTNGEGGREILRGLLAVDADAGTQAGKPAADYGLLRLLEYGSATPAGPGQVLNQIKNSPERSQNEAEQLSLAQYITQNSTGGKTLTFGNLLTFPLEGRMFYVQPLYVQAASGSGSFPQNKVDRHRLRHDGGLGRHPRAGGQRPVRRGQRRRRAHRARRHGHAGGHGRRAARPRPSPRSRTPTRPARTRSRPATSRPTARPRSGSTRRSRRPRPSRPSSSSAAATPTPSPSGSATPSPSPSTTASPTG